jgi:hypothetical protein
VTNRERKRIRGLSPDQAEVRGCEVPPRLAARRFVRGQKQGLPQHTFEADNGPCSGPLDRLRKVVTGIGLMCAPVIAWVFFRHIGIISLKLMAIAVMIGLWGCWQALTGTVTLLAPKMESGDVAE